MTASKANPQQSPLVIAGQSVAPGSKALIELPITKLATGSSVSLPIMVLHGKRPGKRLFLTAAIHGDEVSGIAIVRQCLEKIRLSQLCGSVIAVPVTNVLGFLQESRYLPDRRDLNRSFPGSAKGPLGGRLAHLILQHIVKHCDYGIDLHTGSDHRTNLPHIRADLQDPTTRRIARAFGAPVMLHAPKRKGSLREAAAKLGARTLVFEAGEAQRWSPQDITAGVRGIIRVMQATKMLPQKHIPPSATPYAASHSKWIRASRGGLVTVHAKLGDVVNIDDPLASVADAFGTGERTIRSPYRGVVIGALLNPVVHKGDAILHVAWK